jgi:Gas vesicle protein G
MSLLTLPFRLPLLPVRGVIWLAQIINEEAEQQLYDPANVRRQLEEAEEAHRSGDISERDVARIAEEAAGRLVGSAGEAPADGGGTATGADPDG